MSHKKKIILKRVLKYFAGWHSDSVFDFKTVEGEVLSTFIHMELEFNNELFILGCHYYDRFEWNGDQSGNIEYKFYFTDKFKIEKITEIKFLEVDYNKINANNSFELSENLECLIFDSGYVLEEYGDDLIMNINEQNGVDWNLDDDGFDTIEEFESKTIGTSSYGWTKISKTKKIILI